MDKGEKGSEEKKGVEKGGSWRCEGKWGVGQKVRTHDFNTVTVQRP